jgi:hypothetical protein
MYLGTIFADGSAQLEHVKEVQAALSSYTSYMAEDARVNVRTAVGRQEIAQKKARESLRKIGDALRAVQDTMNREMSAAAEQQQRALDQFAPPYKSQPWAVHIDLTLAARMAGDPSINSALMAAAESGSEVPSDYADYARAAIRLPAPVWRGTVEQQNAIVKAVGGGLLSAAVTRGMDAQRICGAAARKLLVDASLSYASVAAVSQRLADLMTADAQEPSLRPLSKDNGIYAAAKDAGDADVPPMQQGDSVPASVAAE